MKKPTLISCLAFFDKLDYKKLHAIHQNQVKIQCWEYQVECIFFQYDRALSSKLKIQIFKKSLKVKGQNIKRLSQKARFLGRLEWTWRYFCEAHWAQVHKLGLITAQRNHWGRFNKKMPSSELEIFICKLMKLTPWCFWDWATQSTH